MFRAEPQRRRGRRRKPLVFDAVRDPRDAILHEINVESQNEAESPIGQAQVGEDLLSMNCCHGFYGLDFDDHKIVDNQI